MKKDIKKLSVEKINEIIKNKEIKIAYTMHDYFDNLSFEEFEERILVKDDDVSLYNDYCNEYNDYSSYADIVKIRENVFLYTEECYIKAYDNIDDIIDEHKVESLYEKVEKYIENAPEILDLSIYEIIIGLKQGKIITNMTSYIDKLNDLYQEKIEDLEDIEDLDVYDLDCYVDDVREIQKILKEIEKLEDENE